jgi:hypothetical protein
MHLGKRSHFPFDILTIIAHIDIQSYRALLALPRFGRRSLHPFFQVYIQNHFIIHTIIKEYVEDGTASYVHEWLLGYPCNEIRHSPTLLDGSKGPALIRHWYPNSQKDYEGWYDHGRRHRVDAPAFIFYYSNDQIREELWYVNGQLHRLDGPAHIEYMPDGRKCKETWYFNGELHRLDGSARIYYSYIGAATSEEYYLYGNEYTKQAYKDELLRLTK